MPDQRTQILVAAYPQLEAATADFDGLVAKVRSKTIRIQAAILITRDADGEVLVTQTGDHLGRKGATWGGGVGMLVGLAAPPLLAATLVGAAAGGVMGRLASKKIETGLHDAIGANLPAGSAALIAMFDADDG